MSGESSTAVENPKLISRKMSKGSGEGSSRPHVEQGLRPARRKESLG